MPRFSRLRLICGVSEPLSHVNQSASDSLKSKKINTIPFLAIPYHSEKNQKTTKYQFHTGKLSTLGPDRISTAGWAVLSGYVDHTCGKLASGQLSTCHETVEPRWSCRGSDRGDPDIGDGVPYSPSCGPDRTSTAGWAALSGYVDHSCGRLASGQLSTCHETVEPR